MQKICFAAAAMFFCLGCGDDESDSDDDNGNDTGDEDGSETDEDTDTGALEDTEEKKDTGEEIDVTCGDDDCLEPIWIEILGGSFEMGSEDGEPVETPVHTVTVPDFEMMKTEVTLAEYAECVIAGDCSVPDKGTPVEDAWEHPDRGNLPINGVTWDEAASFCEWLGGRLPSEAEWEYAARNGGQDIAYPWGDEEANCDLAVMIDEHDEEGCGTIFPHDVCSITDGNTASGLCDMAGNVWEWVQDTYQMSYEGAPDDGSPWEVDGTSDRVLRGGSYRDDEAAVRAAKRSYLFHSASFENLGFRCARL